MEEKMRWIKIIKDISDKYEKTLVTYQEFEDDIKRVNDESDGFVLGLNYKVNCKKPFFDLEFGIKYTGDTTYATTEPLTDDHANEYHINVWTKSLSMPNSEIEQLVKPLFLNFWKSNFRASPSGLISINTFNEAKQFVQNNIDIMYESKNSIFSVLFCDLDEFKKINDEFGMAEGNRIIRETGVLIEKALNGNGVLLNNGGDEFVIFSPKKSYEEAILLAFNIKREFNENNFKTDPIKPNLSIGMASNENIEKIPNFLEVLEQAEKAKLEIKGKKRGQSRFTFIQQDFCTDNIEDSLKLAFCLTKSCLFASKIYNNVWLNAIYLFLLEETKKSSNPFQIINSCLNEFIEFIDFTFDCKIIKSCFIRGDRLDLEPKVSLLDISMVVIHLLIFLFLSYKSEENSDFSLNMYFSKDCNAVAIGFTKENLLWEKGKISTDAKSFSLGKIWKIKSKENISEDSFKLSVLIKIGHENIYLPDKLFAEIIIVDDRPTKGGGLPDFWEATISRLINVLSQNPNIKKAFIIGNKEYGAKTIEKLLNLEGWDEDIIAQKTGIRVKLIKEVKARLRNSLVVCENVRDLINNLTQLLYCFHEPLPLNKNTTLDFGFLIRELKMDTIMLTKEDGCRVKTINEAFPTVLAIARSVKDKEIIYDQAGYELHELVDFKVHLTEPLKDKIPNFYLSEEKSLDDYYETQFLSEKGLFSKFLNMDDQQEKVINHVVEAITSYPKPYATRRAILVIPHDTTHTPDLTPLGLVSIRCIPRITLKKIMLNYSYTWRTVEALVGFPYSIYGSVKYSDFLTQKIKSKLPPKLKDKTDLGFVSYVAHSLHFFMDDYGQKIAKRIIDDSSI